MSVLEEDLTSNASRVSVLETDLTSFDARVIVLETDLSTNASQIEVLETDLSSNVARVDVLETDLTSNAARVEVLETDLSSNAARVDVLETDLSSNATCADVLETDLSSNATRADVLETDLSSNVARVDVLETDLSSNAERVSVLKTDLSSNARRVSVLESNIYYTYGDGTADENGDPVELLGNVHTLKTIVDGLDTGISSASTSISGNTTRIAAIEADYVRNSQLATAAVATGGASLGASILTTSSGIFDFSILGTGGDPPTSCTFITSDFYQQLSDAYEETEFAMDNFVPKPLDWTSYPPLVNGVDVGNTNLRNYTERKSAIEAQSKVDDLRFGVFSFIRLQNATENANGDRIGEVSVEFKKTQGFGSEEVPVWKIGSESSGEFMFYRKATHPTLGCYMTAIRWS